MQVLYGVNSSKTMLCESVKELVSIEESTLCRKVHSKEWTFLCLLELVKWNPQSEFESAGELRKFWAYRPPLSTNLK